MSEDRVAPRTAAGRLTKDEALENARTSTQPEVSLAVDGWYVISGEALAKHEYRIGELAQTKARLREAEAASLDSDELRKALTDLANEAARAVTEPRRFHENEDDRQQALGHEVGKARGLLLALLSAGDKAEAPPNE